MLTAFAIASQVDNLVQLIGHDGSEIWFPDLPEPFNRRAFNPTEIILALLELGFRVTEIAAHLEIYVLGFRRFVSYNVKQLMKTHSGVVVGTIDGNRHAAFWYQPEQQYYDPNGTIHKNEFEIESFYIVDKLPPVA